MEGAIPSATASGAGEGGPPSIGVTFEGPDGEIQPLGLGAVVGRGPYADLQLRDPAISVAHAGVGLRGGALWLLAYRGRVWVDGTRRDDVKLIRGMRIEFAPGVALRVVELCLPDLVPTLKVDEGPEHPMDHLAWHLDADGELQPGDLADWPAVWGAEGVWYAREPGGPVVELEPGEPVVLDGRNVTLMLRSRVAASMSGTRTEVPPIEVHCHHDETEIRIEGRSPVRLYQRSHDILRQLGRLTAGTGRPVIWMALAERVWNLPNQQGRLDSLWPQKRTRLYAELVNKRVPTWLVRCEGGLVQLALRPEDRFFDHDPAT
ncbi:MAG: FHA domain-containing protein [Myxococcota bacterium]